MMRRCFTWVPIGWFRWNQYITSIGLFYKIWGGCGSCEEEESFWKLYSIGVRYRFHALFKKVAQLRRIGRETMKLWQC